MKNEDDWRPSKYVVRTGHLRASADGEQLSLGSRLAANLVAERYEAFVPRYVHGKVLDLGCGKAPLFGCYRAFASDVVTLDWIRSPHESQFIDVFHDLNEPLPFVESTFDCVVLSDVLEHVKEPSRLCREIARALAGGGYLIGNVPFIYPIHEAPHDHFRYTTFGLRYLFESAGLRVVVLEPTGGSLEVLVDMLAKHLAHGGFVGGLLAAWLQALTVRVGRTGVGRSLVRKTAVWYPLGYFFVAVKPGDPGPG
jgi:SAM-dependent methyltransferase